MRHVAGDDVVVNDQLLAWSTSTGQTGSEAIIDVKARDTITFNVNRPIDSRSRIEIDFEYFPATQKYTRNVYSGHSTGSFFKKALKFRVSYFNEGDDPQKILEAEGSLSEEELEIIREAGDDPLRLLADYPWRA